MGKLVKGIVGVAAIVVGVVVPGAQFLIAAGVSLVGSALTDALAKTAKTKDRAAAAATLQVGEVSRQGIFGRAATAGSLVDAFNYGGKYGTDWEMLVIAIADHRCDALEGFYVNDSYVAFAGDGAVAGYKGQLEVYWRDGRYDQDVPAALLANGPGWTANDRGRGVAHVVVAYKSDAADAENPVWPGGRPRFRWVVRGLRCYSARKDSSVGGSGTHRRDNPATWEWTENPIDCRYNWARGIYAGDRVTEPEQLLIGRGLSDIEAPPQNVFARANLCDEQVNGEARYRIGGIVDANEVFLDVENDIAAACAGTIVQPEGSVEIDPGEARAPVAHFTDRELLVGSKVRWSSFLSTGDAGWINTVVASFNDPVQNWQERSAPVHRDIADIQKDGAPREQQVRLSLVSWKPQAERVAEVARRFGRLWGRGQVTLPPRFAEIEEGDWVTWQSDRHFKGATRTFRVEGWGSDRAWHHQLTLRQISASVYSETDPLDEGITAAVQPPRPAIASPAEDAWSLQAGLLSAGGVKTPALIVTGRSDDPAARFVRMEYIQSAGVPAANAAWIDAGITGPDVSRREIAVAAKGSFYVAISNVVDDVTGPRRVIGPVVTSDIAYPDGTPVEPTVLPDFDDEQSGNLRKPDGSFWRSEELLNKLMILQPNSLGGVDLAIRKPGDSDQPEVISTIRTIDFGAAEKASVEQAKRQIDELSAQTLLLLTDQGDINRKFSDAGILFDPATGKGNIYAIEETARRVGKVTVELDAAKASLSLKASTSYVDNAIAQAVIDPSQVPVFDQLEVRIAAAEITLDGQGAAIENKASLAQLDAERVRITDTRERIDAAEGQISTKVETSEFAPLVDRVTSAEQVITALGDVAGVSETFRSVNLLRRDVDVSAADNLLDLLERANSDAQQISALAEARRELTALTTETGAAEARERLRLAAKVGSVEAGFSRETATLADLYGALARDIQEVVTTVGGNTALAQQLLESVDGVLARAGVRLDVNGYVTGWETFNDGEEGAFIVLADLFAVVAPGVDPQQIFEVTENGLRVKAAYIPDLAIDRLRPGRLGADIDIGDGHIIGRGNGFMKVIGSGFGVGGEFIDWFGPEMPLSECSRATAVEYATVNGDKYMGGALSAGVLTASQSTGNVAPDASVSVSTGSNGAIVLVIGSVSISTGTFNSVPGNSVGGATVDDPRVTTTQFDGTFDIRKNGATVQTGTYSGQIVTRQWYDFELGRTYTQSSGSGGGSVTWTDSSASTETRTYTCQMTARNGVSSSTGGFSQRVSITSTEE